MARKMGRAACIFLLICFAPFLLGLAICLLFFPPTWFVLWLLSKPEFQETYLRIKVKTWEECWHIRGAVSPRRFSDAELALQKADETVRVLWQRMLQEAALPFNCHLALKMARQQGYGEIAEMLQEGINMSKAKSKAEC